MKLHEDQIHVPGFLKACTHIWSDDVSRANKSGVYDYYYNISQEFNLPLVDFSNLPDKGVIFVGMCHVLEDILKSMPRTGSYIIVHRTNDRPFTQHMYDCKPVSVKHIYTVDCRVHANDVTAIPFGNASINGEDNILKQVAEETIEPAKTKLFCRYNINDSTPHRAESLSILKRKKFANVILEQIPGDEFYRQVKAHKFTMALAGCGADASRQWAAIQLGSIPIVTDCIEMRFFEDLPLVYCPVNMEDITEEWLSKQDVSGKSTDRMRMSYWLNEINEKKKEL
jgi:hypothetical protein